jgi:hypothetical protein
VTGLILGAATAQRTEGEATVDVDPRSGFALAETEGRQEPRHDLRRNGLLRDRLEHVEQGATVRRLAAHDDDIGDRRVLDLAGRSDPRVEQTRRLKAGLK